MMLRPRLGPRSSAGTEGAAEAAEAEDERRRVPAWARDWASGWGRWSRRAGLSGLSGLALAGLRVRRWRGAVLSSRGGSVSLWFCEVGRDARQQPSSASSMFLAWAFSPALDA